MAEGKRLRRNAARVILRDSEGRVLLIEGRDSTRPESGTWWITPGGGADEGESLEDCARREVYEETGLRLGDLGPVVLHRRVEFPFEEWEIEQDEVFFEAWVPDSAPPVRPVALTEDEQRTLLRSRWWTPAELETTVETVYPEGLAAMVLGGPTG